MFPLAVMQVIGFVFIPFAVIDKNLSLSVSACVCVYVCPCAFIQACVYTMCMQLFSIYMICLCYFASV